MAKEIEVTVPDIGDYHDVPIIEILVQPGERVDKDTPLLTLESDKATLDVPAPDAGTVGALKVKVGDRVSQGVPILSLRVADAVAAPAQTGSAQTEPVQTEPAQTEPVLAERTLSAAGRAAVATVAAPMMAAPAAPAAAPRSHGVQIPDIGDYHDVPIIELFVAEGETVAKDAPLLTLESDKATMEVPAPAAGVVRGLRVKLGDRVSRGTQVCEILADEAAALADVAATATATAAAPVPSAPSSALPPRPAAAPAATAAAATPALLAGAATAGGALLPHASPSVRKFARELGVDLTRVDGSAAHGRITREDVQNYVKQALQAPAPAPVAAVAPVAGGIPPIPAIDFTQFGPVDSKPLPRIRKLSATYLHRSWVNLPHVTQTDDADITELEAFRRAQSEDGGVKLTLLPFVIKAVTAALKAYPEFNASLSPDGETLLMKRYCHIGFAADTPNGLVVPVVRDADRKGVVELAQETAELAKKAREGKLKPDEMKGGCFSISSLGGIGGGYFTPIINAPEVAILGVSKSQMKPVWDGQQFVPRLMLPLSLSYDHRVIDGAYAARFSVLLVKLLGDLRRLIL